MELLGSKRKLTKVLQCLLGTAKDDSDDPDNIRPEYILRRCEAPTAHKSECQKMVEMYLEGGTYTKNQKLQLNGYIYIFLSRIHFNLLHLI